MKILTTIHNIENIDLLKESADGFLIGTSLFAKHLTADFTNNLEVVIKRLYETNKEIFIQLNRMYTNEEISKIDAFISKLDLSLITGFMVADIGLLQIFKKYNILNKFVYNPETLLTNYFDFNYLKNDGILGAFASKEITAKDIRQIGLKKEIKLFMYGHGHMSMFYTKRQILSLYTNYMQKDSIYHERTDLRLKEPKRENETYPVFEDQSGTHVFRGQVLSSLAFLDDLKDVVDYLVIDTIFKSDAYAKDIIELYKDENLNEEKIESIKEKYQEVWHEGFFKEKSMIKGE